MASNRVPAGVPTGGRFAPGAHDETDTDLTDTVPVDGPAPGDGPAGSWADRPVHDLMTEMAPDLATEIALVRRGGQEPPPGVTAADWDRRLERLETSFRLLEPLHNEPFFTGDEQATFDMGMEVLRAHSVDGRLAAHTASVVTPALNRFAHHLYRRCGYEPDHPFVTEINECAAAFDQARIDFTNGVTSPERRQHTEQAADWLAINYLRLWS